MSKHTSEYTVEEQAAAEERYEQSLKGLTPGPWLFHLSDAPVNLWRVYMPPYEDKVDAETVCHTTSRANAALIAAAPEMLETLKYIQSAFDQKELPTNMPLYAAVSLVIAKAKGK